jgi:choline kinase
LKAIILAAGEGKRLRPLTEKAPKGLVSIFGKSLLEWQIDTYHSCNIHDISIVTGYKGDMIKFPNVTYFRNERYDSTNMVETLFCAREKMVDSVIVSYGDIVFEKNVLDKLIASKEDYSVIIDKKWERYWKQRFAKPLDDAESLLLDEHDYITEIGQKTDKIEKIQGQYIGLMKFQNDALIFIQKFYDQLKKSGKNPINSQLTFEKSYMTDFLQGLINEKRRLKAVFTDNGWLELDSMDDFQLYQNKFKDKTISEFISLPINAKC